MNTKQHNSKIGRTGLVGAWLVGVVRGLVRPSSGLRSGLWALLLDRPAARRAAQPVHAAHHGAMGKASEYRRFSGNSWQS